MLHYVVDLSELKRDFRKRAIVSGTAVMLILLADHVYAVQDQCTHLGASLSKGIHHEEQVACRLHGATFNIKTGDVMEKAHIGFIKMPTKKLKTFKTEVKEGRVFIDI